MIRRFTVLALLGLTLVGVNSLLAMQDAWEYGVKDEIRRPRYNSGRKELSWLSNLAKKNFPQLFRNASMQLTTVMGEQSAENTPAQILHTFGDYEFRQLALFSPDEVDHCFVAERIKNREELIYVLHLIYELLQSDEVLEQRRNVSSSRLCPNSRSKLKKKVSETFITEYFTNRGVSEEEDLRMFLYYAREIIDQLGSPRAMRTLKQASTAILHWKFPSKPRNPDSPPTKRKLSFGDDVSEEGEVISSGQTSPEDDEEGLDPEYIAWLHELDDQ